jgi:hypothetical protein
MKEFTVLAGTQEELTGVRTVDAPAVTQRPGRVSYMYNNCSGYMLLFLYIFTFFSRLVIFVIIYK